MFFRDQVSPDHVAGGFAYKSITQVGGRKLITSVDDRSACSRVFAEAPVFSERAWAITPVHAGVDA